MNCTFRNYNLYQLSHIIAEKVRPVQYLNYVLCIALPMSSRTFSCEEYYNLIPVASRRRINLKDKAISSLLCFTSENSLPIEVRSM